MDLSYIINHLGEERDQYFNAVSPPIIQSSNFTSKTVADMRHTLQHEFEEPFYTRGYNPTVAILRKKLAALEGADDALVTSSGSAACAIAIMGNLKAGDHAVCVNKPYSWTNKLFNNILVNYGVETTMIDGTDPENYARAIKPNTKLFFLESPNSLTFELQDIEAVATIAKKHNIVTIMDNSYTTPLYQQPIKMGIDITIHSATKYLNGHSDIVAGVLCGSKEMIGRLFASELMTYGSIISPHDAWLMIRGLRTLPIRLERSNTTTQVVVEYLENHPKVKQMFFPFSKSFPQYELAKKQMKGCGGMFSILLNVESMEQVETFCNSLQRFLMACSWGGHESLIFPSCSLLSSQSYDNPYIKWNMIRFYVGLEDADVLIADLEQAFAKI
ncbi:MAG: aminotransferase class I/II-fold pyridoxal phosphate-dependent enzyme [Sphingobacteriales bacterium JAD_PAG50586_3]|nr:MAG: aminotransferase class I/II-fold pyridoxal phosphate-dependent enzyme [Sphingobacteriales bacterium JAD_PAG50586_3]